MKTSIPANTDHEYEIAEWCDYGFWVIEVVKTEREAKERVKQLNSNGSVFMTAVYRKKNE